MTALRAASIRTLCSDDHHDIAAEITNWIGSPDKFAKLLQRSDACLIVAEIDGVMAGLGGSSGDVVTLNYVHPDYRFRGVSKALMGELESRLSAAGYTLARLNSTVTALHFYRSLEWVEVGAADPDTGQPMTKRL